MNRATTIILCLAALAAFIFLAIYEPLTTSSREAEQAAQDGLVLHLDPSKVRTIRLVTGDSEVELKRKGGGWQMGPKPKDRADAAIVQQLLMAAGRMRFVDRMDGSEFKKAESLSEFGLRTPKRRIELEGDQKVTISIGKDGADEDRLYVKTSESGDVFLVADEIERLAFRPVADFRDRRLTNLTPDQVDRVVIRRQGGEIELSHDAEGWKITKPLHAPADEKKVNDFLKQLLETRIIDFVADDSGDLGSYGLTEGDNEIAIFAEGSSRPQTLRLGKDKTGLLFGQFTARDSIYRLPADTMEALQTSVDELRDRRLLPLNLDIVDLIRIRAGGKEFSVARTGEKWVVKSGAQTQPASAQAVKAMVEAMGNTKTTSYATGTTGALAQAGLDSPKLTVAFYSVLSENTPEAQAGEQLIAEVAFGKGAGGQVPTHTNDSPEIAMVPEGILKAIPADAAGWASGQ